MIERIPWPSGNPRPPLMINFVIHGKAVHVVGRYEGRGDRGMTMITWRLSDGSKIVATAVPVEINEGPTDPSGQAILRESGFVDIDAGARGFGKFRLDVYPYEIHIHE